MIPIEFDALAATYGRGDGPCALGAVKTNIGHLEAAAGIAGFIKAALSVQRGQIPPNLNFAQWNPAIDASATRLFVPTDLAPWPDCPGPRRAAVSSFGLGGTNAHVVLEQGPDPVPASDGPSDSSVSTLVVSGRTTERVASWASVLADWMESDGAGVTLADVAHTLNITARITASSPRCVRLIAPRPSQGCGHWPRACRRRGWCVPRETPAGPGTVFVYSGQGAQWAGMGRQLMADEPAFAAAVAELEPVFVEQVGFSLRQVLADGEPLVGIDRIQPVLVGMHLALTELWRSYGVEPDAVIGHSMGEVSAAVVAGALSPADGLRVIATRSRLMSRLSGQGAMALLELDASATEALIADYPDVTLAVYASPRQTVIAGPPEQVDAVIAVVDAQGRLARRIEVDVASHHPTIDPILPELRSALADLAPTTPQIPLISTTGQRAAAQRRCSMPTTGWPTCATRCGSARPSPLPAQTTPTFVEISPHPLLTHAITESLESVRSSRRYPRGGNRATVTTTKRSPSTRNWPPCGRRWVGDARRGRSRLVDIPPTPWLHSKYWVANRADGRQLTGAHPLLGVHVEMPSGRDHVWQADVGTDVIPWLEDHKVHGQPVMPAAAFAEIALAAGSEALGLPVDAVEVNRLEVEQMLPLGSQTQVTT